jgi:8-oxo-dGTP diphosphatase/2-hydroxy-dATP diphosphatase
MTRIETVLIVHQPPKILLGMKKVRFGRGRYNGFGGEINNNESIIEAGIRETLEEAGIIVEDPEIYGQILFKFQSDEQDHLVHFLRASKYLGIPRETEEMKPEWVDESQIPYDKMWKDDAYWLPLMLSGKKFQGEVLFDKNHEIINCNINPINL